MLARFIQEVNNRADELDVAVRDRQHDVARIIALQIAGVAPTMGFPKLAQLAQNAEQSLRATMSVDESLAPIAMLMRLCRDVRLKKAA